MLCAARSALSIALQATAHFVVFLFIAAFLLRFPPDHSSFYPRCPIYTLFHLQCPGCGGTRAVAALLRGNIGEALRLNALVTLSSPILLFAAIPCRRLTRRLWISPSQPVIYAALVITAIFTIARNL